MLLFAQERDVRIEVGLGEVLGRHPERERLHLDRALPARRRLRFTHGLGGTSILAALFDAVFLLVVVGGLKWEAIPRFSQPEPAGGRTVMTVGACGIVLNGFCDRLFASGSKGGLNMRGAFMHMVSDALVSLGVVVGGFIILMTGWHWIDRVMSTAKAS